MEVGAIQVPINPKGSAEEFAGFVAQVAPALIVTDDALAPLFATADAPRLDVGALYESEPDGRGPATLDPSDVAVMIPTSGTTGRSKLVMQTHLSYVMAGEGFPYWLRLTSDDRLMTSLPLFHINAPAYSTLGSLVAGASLVLLPGFSATGFIDSARKHGVTEFNSIGAMIEILMRQPARRRRRQSGAAVLHRPVSRSRAASRDRGPLRVRSHVRIRDVGVAVRSRVASRHPAVRRARIAPATSAARSRERRASSMMATSSHRERSASWSCTIPR